MTTTPLQYLRRQCAEQDVTTDQAYTAGYLEAVAKYAADFKLLLYVAAAGWILTTALTIILLVR